MYKLFFLILNLVVFSQRYSYCQFFQHGIGVNVTTPLAYIVNKGAIDSFGRISPMIQYNVHYKQFSLVVGFGASIEKSSEKAFAGPGTNSFLSNNNCASVGIYYTKTFANNWFVSGGINYVSYSLTQIKEYFSGVDKISFFNKYNGYGIGPSCRAGYIINSKFSISYEYNFYYKNFIKQSYQYYSAVPNEKVQNSESAIQYGEVKYPLSIYLNYRFNHEKN